MVTKMQKTIVDKRKKIRKESKHTTREKSSNHKGRELDKKKEIKESKGIIKQLKNN